MINRIEAQRKRYKMDRSCSTERTLVVFFSLLLLVYTIVELLNLWTDFCSITLISQEIRMRLHATIYASCVPHQTNCFSNKTINFTQPG